MVTIGHTLRPHVDVYFCLTSHRGLCLLCLLYHQASNANGPTTGTTLSAPLAALSMTAIAY